MSASLRTLVTLALVGTAVAAPTVASAQRYVPGTPRWYRGNTHTHTKNSDGDAAPDVVARWYREHGYQFVVITDHEFLTPIDGLNATIGAPNRFLVMQGQEVTQWTADPARRTAHINAIGNKRVVFPMGTIRCIGEGCGGMASKDTPLGVTYKTNIANVLAAGGLPQINHPNAIWAVQPPDLYEVPDSVLFEVWNATKGAHNLGGVDDSGHVSISTEALWDTLLTRGKVIWGVGSDDTHDTYPSTAPDAAPPGQAWVMVRADTLTAEAITTALRQGHFYASNGVTLVDIVTSDTSIAITIKPTPAGPEAARYRTQFIGSGGRVLAEVTGTKPQYRIKKTDGYVRAVITDSNGEKAWTQPVFVRK